MAERAHGYDLGAITRKIQRQFLRDPETDELTNRFAHPKALAVLVNELQAFTDELVEKARNWPGPAFGAWGGPTEMWSNDPATARDMKAWLGRLEGYRKAVNNCIVAGEGFANLPACAWKPVTEPLLLGWYPGRKWQSIPDFTTPFILANAYGVSEEFARDNWDKFVTDLEESWPVETVKKSWEIVRDFSPVGLLADLGGEVFKKPVRSAFVAGALVTTGVVAAVYLKGKKR